MDRTNQDYLHTLKANADRTIFCPAVIKGDGQIENITQVRYEIAGRKLTAPKKGVKGAHIFLTQKQIKNGRITDKPAFRSVAVNMEADTEIAKDANGKISTQIELNAVMVKLGRIRQARHMPRSFDQIFAQASACALAHLSNSAKGGKTTGSKQTGDL
jgi:hypothetical protein